MNKTFDRDDIELTIDELFQSIREGRESVGSKYLTTNDYNNISKIIIEKFRASNVEFIPNSENSDDGRTQSVDVVVSFKFTSFNTMIKNETPSTYIVIQREKELLNTIEKLTIEKQKLIEERNEVVDLILKTLQNNK